MLQFNHLTYRWPNTDIDTINSLSLSISAGEWIALVGDNGAGKSTFLRLAAGLLQPSQGDVRLEGMPLRDYRATERANRVGILFQEAEKQIFHSTVKDEVAFGLRRQKLAKDDIAQRTAQALENCHLTDVANKHPLDLHSGQRRMVAVACLDALAPKLLLLDEPSRDFDALWMTYFEDWLEMQRTKGTTIIAISHDLDFVARHFQRVLHLCAGNIIGDDIPERILHHANLQPDSALPAPTLMSLTQRLQMSLSTSSHANPQTWTNEFLAKYLSTHFSHQD